MIPKRLVLLSCACITAAMLWPAEAAAQRRGAVVRRAPIRRAVVVSAGFGFGYGYYRPYYFSPFYSPFYGAFYSPFYDPFWYSPYYAQYPRYYYGRSWASARIEVKPRDAQVFLDGYFVGMVDQFDGVFQRLDLPSGEHELTVYMPGYRTYRQKTLFRPGEGYHFKAILEPLPAGAPAEPQPTPSAADPYREPRDPYYRQPGDTDPRDPRDPREPRDARDPRDPRDPGRTRPLPDRPGDRGAESRDFGTLNVRVQPADAVVIIDGERWDTPEGGSRLVVELAAGPHRIEVRKDGFKSYTSTVQIRPGQTEALNVSLSAGGDRD